MSWFWNRKWSACCRLCLAGMLLSTSTVSAQINFSGFATFGVTSSNSDDLLFRSSLTRWPESGTNLLTESLVGLQFNYRASDKVDIVVQSILDNRDYDSVSDYFSLAFLRYQIDRNLSFKIGRMNYNAYILSEYLGVGYSYLWATPPVEFYAPSSYLRYIDGAEIQYRHGLEEGILQGTLAVGTSKANILNIDADASLDFKYVVNSSISYENESWLLKATFSYNKGKRTHIPGLSDFQTQFSAFPAMWWPGLADIYDDLNFDNKIIKYGALGVNYTNDNWLVKSEVAIYDVHCCIIGDVSYGYLSIGYELGDVLPYVTLAAIESTYDKTELGLPQYDVIPDPNLQQLYGFIHAQAQTTYDTARIDQSSLSVGVRWDFMSNWALKGQFSRYRLGGPGYGLWGSYSQNPIADHRNINVLSINLSTIF